MLGQPKPTPTATEGACADITDDKPRFVCRHCGSAMLIVQIFARNAQIRAPPEPASLS